MFSSWIVLLENGCVSFHSPILHLAAQEKKSEKVSRLRSGVELRRNIAFIENCELKVSAYPD